MDEAFAELAYFRSKSRLADEDLVRLTAAARAAGNRWDGIGATCGVQAYQDLAGVIDRITGETGAELLFSATQDAARQLTGAQHRYPPLTWHCPGCEQQVTDPAPAGRPVHVEHGHALGCTRLARDQAADVEEGRRRHVRPVSGFQWVWQRLRSRPASAVSGGRCAGGSWRCARCRAGTGRSSGP